MTQSRRQPPTPDAITAALGRRLTELRKAAGIRSQADLGEKMTNLGVPWSRVSVEKLENGRRGSITVQELLALALVLDVAPITLIADPRHPEDVRIAKNLTVDSWDALMWLAGSGTIQRSDLDRFSTDAIFIEAAWNIVEAVAQLGRREKYSRYTDPEAADRARERDEERHRDARQQLEDALAITLGQGADLPPFLPPEFSRDRTFEVEISEDELRRREQGS